MDCATTMSSNAKYNWCEVPRVEPPMRSVQERTTDFHEVVSLYDVDTVRQQASRCVNCGVQYCRQGCLLSNRIPEWLALVAEGKFHDAFQISISTSNMPEICSRVCPQERLCESMCTLNTKGAPIPIGAIEKFVVEWAFAHGDVKVEKPAPNGHSVAIIGAGPAGLACADELALRGFAVTVFEAKSYLGGRLMYGIPAFKLEKSVIERRAAIMQQRGVTFRTNTAIGRDISFKELLAKFDAVFVAMGNQVSKPLQIPGANLPGVYQAMPFLGQTKVGDANGQPPVAVRHRHVVVLGGGDTAMDAVRTVIRDGAQTATCVYRRSLDDMPAAHREYGYAVDEGAHFIFQAMPVAIEASPVGHVGGVRCVRTMPGPVDATGRSTPVPVPDSEFVIPANVVLVAYGADAAPLPVGDEWSQIATTKTGDIVVDENQMTTLPRVFAASVQPHDPTLVGAAVRIGRRAAECIHSFVLQPKKQV